ncbi:MAG: M24 family metallopeptidase [Anaerolineae bacterium]
MTHARLGRSSSRRTRTRQEKAAAPRPGAGASSIVDAAACCAIAASSATATTGHGLGHGVGMDTSTRRPRSLTRVTSSPGAATSTVELGVYLPGRFGVRIEDLVLVTADGVEFPGRPAS